MSIALSSLDDASDRDTDDPGIIPGGIRDRAMRAVLRRGSQIEDRERMRASQQYWAARKRQRETKPKEKP